MLGWAVNSLTKSKNTQFMETKTHWKKLHNPDFLGSYSLMNDQGLYTEMSIKFKSIANKSVKGEDGKDAECIVAQVHNNKPMILNATNCKTLAKLFNSQAIEDWLDKPVTICVKKIKAFGDTVDALRVDTKLPTPAALPVLNEQHPKWEGAVTALKAGNTTIDKIKKSYTLSEESEQKLSSFIKQTEPA